MPRAPETEKQRRIRHRGALSLALLHGPERRLPDALELIARCATYAAVPGRQKRDAAYMIQAREQVVRAVVRAPARVGAGRDSGGQLRHRIAGRIGAER